MQNKKRSKVRKKPVMKRNLAQRIAMNDPALLRMSDGRYKAIVYNSRFFKEQNEDDFRDDFFRGMSCEELGEKYCLPDNVVRNWSRALPERKRKQAKGKSPSVNQETRRPKKTSTENFVRFVARRLGNEKVFLDKAIAHCSQSGVDPVRVAQYFNIDPERLLDALRQRDERAKARQHRNKKTSKLSPKKKLGRPKLDLRDLARKLEDRPSEHDTFWSTSEVHARHLSTQTLQTARNNLKTLGVQMYKDFRNSTRWNFDKIDYGQLVKNARNKASIFFVEASRLKYRVGKIGAVVSVMSPGKDTRFRFVKLGTTESKIRTGPVLAPLLLDRLSSEAAWAWRLPKLILVIPDKGLISVEELETLEAKHPERVEVIVLPSARTAEDETAVIRELFPDFDERLAYYKELAAKDKANKEAKGKERASAEKLKKKHRSHWGW